MQSRANILTLKIQAAAAELERAENVRSAAMAEVRRNPSSEKADAALNEALAAVPRAKAVFDALLAEMKQAKLDDEADALAEKREACLDYAKRAIEVAGKRVEVAKKLDALLAKLPGIVAEFTALDQEAAALIAVALPHDLRLPQHGNSTAFTTLFNSRIATALLAPLAAAGFPTWDKIGSPTSLNASKLIAWVHGGNHHAGAHPDIAASKVKIADAVQAANETFAREIERLQKHAGLIGDAPQAELEIKSIAEACYRPRPDFDDSSAANHPPEVVWGLPPETAARVRNHFQIPAGAIEGSDE